MPYAAVGLLYCGIDTTQPGTYIVTFTVVHDNNATVSVQRTVVVQSLCRPGEVACSDGTCGERGVLLAGGMEGAGCLRLPHQGGVIIVSSHSASAVTLPSLGCHDADMCSPTQHTNARRSD